VLNGHIRGIITTLASICFSASIGRWIDHTPNRLKTLLSTITANRLSVIAACVFWVFIVGGGNRDLHERFLAAGALVSPINSPVSGLIKKAFFALVLVLGVFEKLSGAANMMSMERDWVVTVAAADGQAYDLTRLNAVMRRIDLICKLVAPIVLSIIISASGSVQVGVLVVGGMSAASWAVEWWCARRVWNNNSKLQRPKISRDVLDDATMAETPEELPPLSRVGPRSYGLLQRIVQWSFHYTRDFRQYFSSHVWIPSLALSLLHLSALSYSATFITYLLNVGFSLNLITVARALGSVVEISSTIVTPFGVDYLGKAHHHHRLPPQYEEEDSETALLEGIPEQQGNTETGLERLGLWGITWQLLNLVSTLTNPCFSHHPPTHSSIKVPVVLALWALSPSTTSTPPSFLSLIFPSTPTTITASPPAPPILLALTLFTFLSASRLGLWIYDLTTQQLTQTLVPSTSRSSFAGVENSFVAFFELSQHVATIVLSRPEHFRWLALGSWAAVAGSACLYAGWVWRQRGHLVHWEVLGKGCGGGGRGGV
jgi:iron-regulated transporter 1